MEFFGSINAVYVLVGSTLLGACGGLLGVFAVLRKQGLLGDALAHGALPGIVMAFIVMQSKFLPGLLLGALVSGLIGAYGIYALVNYSKIKMDTAMASVLSVFFGIGVLLLTYVQKLPNASQSGLETFLFGQTAALLKSDVIFIAIVFAVLLLTVLVFWKELKLFVFDQRFSAVAGFKLKWLEFLFMSLFVVAILMSLQAVGVVLTAAVFITPAVAALFLSNRLCVVVLLSSLFGAIAGGSGAYISSVVPKMPTGPVIVIVASVIFLTILFFSPKRGLIRQFFSRKNYSLKVQIENVLARFYRDKERGIESLSLEEYSNYGYRPKILRKLLADGFLKKEENNLFLTKQGLEKAQMVVRKHRLWETYLVHKMEIAPDHVHRDAEGIEHILSDEMVAKLNTILKNPKEDPHGKPLS